MASDSRRRNKKLILRLHDHNWSKSKVFVEVGGITEKQEFLQEQVPSWKGAGQLIHPIWHTLPTAQERSSGHRQHPPADCYRKSNQNFHPNTESVIRSSYPELTISGSFNLRPKFPHNPQPLNLQNS